MLLGLLLLRMLRAEQASANRWMIALIGAYAVQAVLIGLHWGYGLQAVLPLQSIMAAALPPLAWLAFRSFVTAQPPSALHALPPLVLAGLWLTAPWMIDATLAAIFVGYGIALLRLAWRGADALTCATLDGSIPVSVALWITAIKALLSPITDFAINQDLLHDDGRNAGFISGLASMISIGLLSAAAAWAGRRAPVPVAPSAPTAVAEAPVAGEGDIAIVAALDALLHERALHHDPNLSLERLARRLAVPARAVSSAINRVRGMNVSQYVNGFRVADACRLLAETEMPVTQVFLAVGFQTKSNFNREFLRVTGRTPTAWRAQALAPARLGPHPVLEPAG
ncbi:AraC family transcriptional regulator [Acidisoma sp. 7E03]